MSVAFNQENMKTLIIIALFLAYTFAIPEEVEDEIEVEVEDPGSYGIPYYKPPKLCKKRVCKTFKECKFVLKKVCKKHCPYGYRYGYCKYTCTKTPTADCSVKIPKTSCWTTYVKCAHKYYY